MKRTPILLLLLTFLHAMPGCAVPGNAVYDATGAAGMETASAPSQGRH
jgi:hypothetical protein